LEACRCPSRRSPAQPSPKPPECLGDGATTLPAIRWSGKLIENKLTSIPALAPPREDRRGVGVDGSIAQGSLCLVPCSPMWGSFPLRSRRSPTHAAQSDMPLCKRGFALSHTPTRQRARHHQQCACGDRASGPRPCASGGGSPYTILANPSKCRHFKQLSGRVPIVNRISQSIHRRTVFPAYAIGPPAQIRI
jgi:hypothetical protein